MTEIETLQLYDSGSNDECWVMIRASNTIVALGVSLRDDGDYEVFFSKSDCGKLISALTKAMDFSEGKEKEKGPGVFE